MAVQKAYEAPTGAIFTDAYWIIGNVTIARRSRVIEAAIEVFVNAAARQAEKVPVASVGTTIPTENYDAILSGGIPALYEALKHSVLADGVDV